MGTSSWALLNRAQARMPSANASARRRTPIDGIKLLTHRAKNLITIGLGIWFRAYWDFCQFVNGLSANSLVVASSASQVMELS
jgi:hypothetical protein